MSMGTDAIQAFEKWWPYCRPIIGTPQSTEALSRKAFLAGWEGARCVPTPPAEPAPDGADRVPTILPGAQGHAFREWWDANQGTMRGFDHKQVAREAFHGGVNSGTDPALAFCVEAKAKLAEERNLSIEDRLRLVAEAAELRKQLAEARHNATILAEQLRDTVKERDGARKDVEAFQRSREGEVRGIARDADLTALMLCRTATQLALDKGLVHQAVGGQVKTAMARIALLIEELMRR